MKKKVMTAVLAAALAGVALVGGTLAYFTDTDDAVNTFTVGGVSVELIEQQRGENGLEDFKDGQVLMPIVGSAQVGSDEVYGLPTAKNYVDKIVTVKNDGKSDAWVRAYFAIPSALDDGEDTYNAGMNILHFNYGVYNGAMTADTYWFWKTDGEWNYYETTIEGVSYNVYYADYYQPLKSGVTTEQFVSGLYLDANVDMNAEGQYTITRNDETSVITDFDGTVKCPVATVAVQAEGFETVDAAITGAFGANFDPFNA